MLTTRRTQKKGGAAKRSSATSENARVQLKGAGYADQTANLSPVGHEGGTVESAPGGAQLASYVQAQSGGQGLDGSLKGSMESGFGRDLGQVQFHTGSQASTACDALGAKAFSLGNNVFFGKGSYDPQSAGGQHLIAHEITHTLQGGTGPQAKLRVGGVADSAEAEADRVADQVVRRIQTKSTGAPSYVIHATHGGAATQVQRKEALSATPIAISATGGMDVVRRMARAPEPVEDTDANYDEFVSGVATANVLIRGMSRTLELVAQNGRGAQAVRGLTAAAGDLNAFGTALGAVGRAAPWVTMAIGVYNLANAETREEAEDAILNLAVHLGMGLAAPLAIADAILTAIFGPTWPSQALRATAEMIDAVWEDVQDAVVTHIGGPPFERLASGRYYRTNDALCDAGMEEFCP